MGGCELVNTPLARNWKNGVLVDHSELAGPDIEGWNSRRRHPSLCTYKALGLREVGPWLAFWCVRSFRVFSYTPCGRMLGLRFHVILSASAAIGVVSVNLTRPGTETACQVYALSCCDCAATRQDHTRGRAGEELTTGKGRVEWAEPSTESEQDLALSRFPWRGWHSLPYYGVTGQAWSPFTGLSVPPAVG